MSYSDSFLWRYISIKICYQIPGKVWLVILFSADIQQYILSKHSMSQILFYLKGTFFFKIPWVNYFHKPIQWTGITPFKKADYSYPLYLQCWTILQGLEDVGWYVRLWLQEQGSKAVFGHQMAKKGAVLLTSISTQVRWLVGLVLRS